MSTVKPMTLTIHEGRWSTAPAGGTDDLQVGSQQRSEWAFRTAAEMVRNGWISGSDLPPAQAGLLHRDAARQPIPEGSTMTAG
jgi:hypothetical protein